VPAAFSCEHRPAYKQQRLDFHCESMYLLAAACDGSLAGGSNHGSPSVGCFTCVHCCTSRPTYLPVSRCHIKMSPPWKIRPGRDNHGIDVFPLVKYRRPHKSPHYRIAFQKCLLWPGRQFTGKNPSRPVNCRPGRVRLFWGNPITGHRPSRAAAESTACEHMHEILDLNYQYHHRRRPYSRRSQH